MGTLGSMPSSAVRDTPPGASARPEISAADVGLDEAWYMNRNPDVANNIAKGGPSPLKHYLQYGRREGRLPRPIIHLHVPKTAGTTLRGALERSVRRVLVGNPDFSFEADKHANVDVFSGHFGFRGASTVTGDIITVLRDPTDRFLSFYYYLVQLHNSGKEISDRTTLAAKYGLERIVELFDCEHFVEPLFNGMTWQLAYGNLMRERIEYRKNHSPSDDALLQAAKDNIDRFTIVGMQDLMPRFWKAIEARYGMTLDPHNENTNSERIAMDDVPRHIREKINNWIYLDVELYRYVRDKMLSSGE